MKNNTLKAITKILLILFFITPFFVSCDKNENTTVPITTDTVQIVKNFVYDVTKTYYLWEEYIPGGIDVNTYNNPFALFEDMYYPTLDKWSFVTDDYRGLINSLNGIRKAAGFKYQPFRYAPDSDDLFLLVEYVHTDGEAFKAGLERGDVIITINGTTPTVNNYSGLVANDVLEFTIGEIQNDQVVNLNETISVTKIEQSFSPILKQQVITASNGKKVGYFLYDQFIDSYNKEMGDVINSFKAQGIEELVLDLRYNPGGYVSTCALLANMILPSVYRNEVFLTYQWNNVITSQLGGDPDYQYLFQENFPDSAVNLNLNKLYVLTSERSASASEAIIIGLKPYMEVVVIGEQTHGKYTSVNVFYNPDDPPKHNWGIFLVTSKIANVDGFTDYVNGLTPDYFIEDDYITPLGDETEPLLAQALSLITSSVAKSTKKLPEQYKSVGPVYESWIDKGIFINDTKPPRK